MAGIITTTKLEPDAHLLLDQPLLQSVSTCLRKNFKTAQRHIEQATKNITKDVQSIDKSQNSAALVASLDATLLKAQNLQRKLEQLRAEENALHWQQQHRIEHLQQLHDIPSLADVKYDIWSHTRLDRLLVDYLVRQGYSQSAKELAAEKHIDDLADIDIFEECNRIESSLLQGKTQECLVWCNDNKQTLKKSNSNLELELRLQQIIELSRTGDMKNLLDAIVHARKHLVGAQDTEFGLRAGGLLAHTPDTFVEPYRMMYSSERYTHLAKLFVKTHHELYAQPPQAPLHIALSAGLSALKTPSCHSEYALRANANTGAPVCPICSTELNELARNVPYAHHTKSYMEEDPVVLPNGRLFGRERLIRLNEKLGTKPGRIRDPTRDPADTENEWHEDKIRKVFIS